MKIWFLVIALIDCIVCPTEKPSIHFSIEDAAMEAARYKQHKMAFGLFLRANNCVVQVRRL
jgi:hypothetical protein